MHKISVLWSLPILAIMMNTASSTQQSQPENYKSNSTGSTQQALDLMLQSGNSFLHEIFNSTDKPGWLTRTDISYAMQHSFTPVSAVETIQPLFQDQLNTAFWQARAAYNSGSITYNLGLGLRRLFESKQFMWGANIFFDENPRLQHKRVGIGGEAFTPYVTLRANYYDAISGKQYEGGGSYEQALNGYDVSVEAPVPYLSWMRFNAEGYHWEGVHASNVDGGSANLRVFPATQVELDAGVSYDNSQHTQAFLKLNYYLGSPEFIEYSASTSQYPGTFAPQDLEKMRLQKVLRHNDIVVEKTQKVGTTAIIVARGN